MAFSQGDLCRISSRRLHNQADSVWEGRHGKVIRDCAEGRLVLLHLRDVNPVWFPSSWVTVVKTAADQARERIQADQERIVKELEACGF